nr:Tol-Pal system protein TolB [uncultured bacterium]
MITKGMDLTSEEILQCNSYRDTILSYTVRFPPTRMEESARLASRQRPSRLHGPAIALFLILICILSSTVVAQDWVKTGTSLGVEKVRLAVPDFKPSTPDPQNTALLKTFNDTLWNDLDVSGVVELASKSFYPLQIPGQPAEVNFLAWNVPPPNAAMLAFGSLGVAAGRLTVQAWLYDVKNIQSPQVLGKQYGDTASDAAARMMAHKFADEIIFRLGGGIPGIAESQIYFVSDRSGHKEIWAMDYDGSNQHQLTHLGAISISPRISPDGSRIAFSSLTKTGWEIMMYSMDLSRMVSFPHNGRHESFAGVVGRRDEAGVLLVTRGRAGDLGIGCVRGKSTPHHDRERTRCFSGVEPENEHANRLRQWTLRPAADLHHGG